MAPPVEFTFVPSTAWTALDTTSPSSSAGSDSRRDKTLAPTRSRRQRSSIACEECHRRKVRCDVSRSNGRSCRNCVLDGIECKAYRKIRPFRRHTSPEYPNDKPSTISTTLDPIPELIDKPEPSTQTQLGTPSYNEVQLADLIAEGVDNPRTENTVLNSDTARDSKQIHVSDIANVSAFCATLDEPVKSDLVPFFAGDEKGYDFLVQLSRGGRPGLHYAVPRGTARKHVYTTDDLSFLHSKEVFSLPPIPLCNELVRCFFHSVYPFLPIVDPTEFLREYTTAGPSKMSHLLLWSMFFVAASCLPLSSVTAAGFESNKAMKNELFRKAKLLYDMEYELDKVTIIQSLLMISYWYADTEDRTGPCHWVGVSIGLCHTIGLHRDPAASPSASRRFSKQQMSLWRRIWWTCVYRETWNSIAYGRPMRIYLDDCDVPMPSPDDIWFGLAQLSEDSVAEYLPRDRSPLSMLCISQMKQSAILAKLLRAHYGPKGLMSSESKIESDEQEIIRECNSCETYLEHSSPFVKSRAGQVRITYEAMIIALYRPYLRRHPHGLAVSDQEVWFSKAQDKVKTRSDNITTVLNGLASADLIRLCEPAISTVLFMAMTIYIFFSTSSSELSRRHAAHQLDLYQLVLQELRRVSWSAGLIIDMTQKARRMVAARLGLRVEGSPANPSKDSYSDSAVDVAEPERTHPTLCVSPLLTDEYGPFEDMEPWPNIYPDWAFSMQSVLDQDFEIL